VWKADTVERYPMWRGKKARGKQFTTIISGRWVKIALKLKQANYCIAPHILCSLDEMKSQY